MADTRTQVKDMQGELKVVNFNEISQQGCYVLLDTGQLVRVAREAVTPGTSPLITIHQRGLRELPCSLTTTLNWFPPCGTSLSPTISKPTFEVGSQFWVAGSSGNPP